MPSMKQAIWIAEQMDEDISPDDVYDILTGQITRPKETVQEVETLSLEYEDILRRGNARANQN